MKPILFNTEMIRAILDGRKTVTRRVIKQSTNKTFDPFWECYTNDNGKVVLLKAPYSPGDILYVRETWKCYTTGTAGPGLIDGYLYKADEPQDTTGMMVEDRWRPSIHMPKEAARIFLRVTDVRVERLQQIMDDPPGPTNQIVREGCKYGCDFIALWDRTIKPADREVYGWDANPWVWVIEFERREKPMEKA